MVNSSASVVVPAGGSGALLDGCLEALAQQTLPLEIILVDDSVDGGIASKDGVVRLTSGGVGPYAARNMGWRRASGRVILFTDTRSRPDRHWAARLVEALDEGPSRIAGSETRVVAGASWVSRAAAQAQIFDVAGYVDEPWFRPTCRRATSLCFARTSNGLAVSGRIEAVVTQICAGESWMPPASRRSTWSANLSCGGSLETTCGSTWNRPTATDGATIDCAEHGPRQVHRSRRRCPSWTSSETPFWCRLDWHGRWFGDARTG